MPDSLSQQDTAVTRYPLSPLQEGMLFHTLRDTGVGMYVNQAVSQLHDPDLDAYREAWQQVVNRHGILRTTFAWEEHERPIQEVHASMEVPFIVEDWSEVSPEEQSERLTRFLRRDRRDGFDLRTGPLLRLALFQLNPTDYYFVFTHHHIIMDGWSGNLLMQEVRHYYEGARLGEIRPLPDPVPYTDFIDWLESRDLDQVEQFWRQELAGFRFPTPLPLENPKDDVARGPMQFGTWDLVLSEDLSNELFQLARQSRITISTLIQAAWALLLGRHAGESDVVFGTLVSGRPPSLPGVEKIVGMFLNSIPFRAQIDDASPLRDWLQSLKSKQVDLAEYEFSPLTKVKSWSDVPAADPLFESIVSRKDTAGAGAKRRGGGAGRVRKATVQQNFPLLLEVAASDLVELTFTYDGRRFEAGVISRLAEQVRTLLESMVNHPEQTVGQLSMMSAAEYQMVVGDWNIRQAPFPENRCLHEYFEQQSEKSPHAPAVTYGDVTWSYEELNQQANQLAHFLRKHGVGKGDVVGLYCRRSLASVTALLAVLKAGAAYVPLDPAYPLERLNYIIGDAGIHWVLAAGEASATVLKRTDLRVVDVEKDAAGWQDEPNTNPSCKGTLQDLAYILYTSGSTGQPKGVAAPHRVPIARIFAEQPAWQPGEALCSKTSLNFIDSLWELFLPWFHGGRTTLIDDSAVKDPPALVEVLAASEATRIVMVPSLLRALLESDLDLPGRLPKLKYWISSGEPLPEELCRLFRANLPQAVLVNIYGTTETWDVTRTDSREVMNRTKLPMGRVIPNTQAYVVDHDFQPVPIGVVGELLVGGECLPFGYWRRAELTAEKFIPNPFTGKPGERVYRTGDRVRWLPDGNLEYIGRTDHQIKLRGFRIEPGEIEQALERHPDVRQAVVLPHREALAAYLVAVDGHQLEVKTVRDFARQQLPTYMVPTFYLCLVEMPLTPNGKIDRRALPALEDETGLPPQSGEAGRLPQGETEERIAEIWQQVIGLKTVNADAHFFEIGGDSLSAIRVVARLSRELETNIPLRGLLEAPTIAALAQWIESGAHTEDAPDLVHEEADQEAPLTFTQRRLWFLDQLNPGTASYTIPNMLHLNGPLDLNAIEAAFREVVERHQVLRTIFQARDGEPVQVVQPTPEKIHIEVIDLSALPEQERSVAARKAAIEQGRLPWDLANGPLYRVQILTLSHEEHILSTALHHIIADGRSMGIFGREIGMFYHSYTHFTPLTLPDLPVQYADFARWERRMVQGDLFTKQLAFWKKQLSGAVPLELPTDYQRPQVHRFQGKKILFEIPSETANAMRRLSKSENATSFMWLLTGFQLLLARYSRQHDVMIGTAMWNRSRVELEKLIGLFVNTIPMRHDFSGDLTPREALRRVRDGCLGAFANMELPFEEMLKQVKLNRDLSRQGSPLFQVMFIHQPGGTRGQGAIAPGVAMERERVDTGFSNFDLLLSTNDSPDAEISCMISYDIDLFKESTIDRLVRHMQLLFERFAEEPDQPLSSLSFLSDQEREEILDEWSGGEKRPLASQPVHDAIAQHADTRADHSAIQFEERIVSYRELNEMVALVARNLLARGLEREQFVGLCLERSPELIIGMLGIMRAGGTVVTIDPAYPAERIRYILEDTACPYLLASPATQPMLANGGSPAEILLVTDLLQQAETVNPQAPAGPVSMRQLAYVIYTSGSTGKPKGVMVEHEQLANIIDSQISQFQISPESRVLQMLSLSFDAAMGEVFRTLVAGGRLCMANKDDLLPGPGLARRLKEQKITATAMSPTALAALPDVSDALPDLATLTVGGEACPPKLAEKWMRGRRLLNGYGPTETTIGATLAINWDPTEKPPLGRPLPNVELYILDEHLEPVPVGIPGELYIGGVGVARGYLHRPDVTAERFIPHPFSEQPGQRLYRTGDLVRWLASGDLDFLGRIDHQIKIRGHRIELGEIESVLEEAPEVARCVVIDFEQSGVKKLAAYFVTAPGMDLPSGKVREFIRTRVPEYMVPAIFIELEAIPVTANGKVDRRALPKPKMDEVNSEVAYVEPESPLEKQLAALWVEVLGVNKVGINDNFFQLGGDSISSIHVIALAGKQGLQISPRQMFEHQTVGEMAQALEGSGLDDAVGSVSVNSDG